MNQNTLVFFKSAAESVEVAFPVTKFLEAGETLRSIVLGDPEPASNTPLEAALTTDEDVADARILLVGGDDGVGYGIHATIDTTKRVFQILLAVTVQQATLNPYKASDPEAFRDLVDTIEAGAAALGTAYFPFPANVDPKGGFVEWSLLDREGTVFAAGNAFDYRVQSNGLSNIVRAQCVINVPSSVPPSGYGEKYQIQYVLKLNPIGGEAREFYTNEAVSVIGLNTIPLGTQNQVEVKGDPATLSLVTDSLYENVELEIWSDDAVIASGVRITDFERVSAGYYWAGVIDTTLMTNSLLPYVVTWSYWNNAASRNRESAKLWIVTPSILDAIDDVKSRVNKARTTLYGTPDMLFPVDTIMTWLRRGGDLFNAWGGHFTSFTFTNAKGPIREYWLQCAEMMALESQELAEAEKAFNYQGANVSLDVDRTQAYGAAADKIRSRLDQELKPIKAGLIIKGNTGGDGSADPSRLQKGAIGAVGITITPASAYSIYPNGYPRIR